MLKTLIMKAAFIAFLGSISFAAHAIADTQRIEIPAGELIAALEMLAKQANVDLVYQDAQVKGLRTKGVSGELSAQEAVTKLLEGTPLQLRTDEISGAILITTPTPSGANSSPGRGEEGARGSERMRSSQAEPSTRSPGTGEGRDPRSAKGEGSEPSSYESQELPAPEETGKAIPEFLVEGSKTLNADIERTEDDIQPYVVFAAEDIQRSQATTLEDFLKTRLPMNTVQETNSQLGGAVGNLSTINLRGLGSNQTLILIDGRRVPQVNVGGDFSQPDINGIPLAAIERIEVLPATASGIYGGGATGGVVNIITRKDYSGIEARAAYANVFRGNASNYRVDLSTGFNLENGRTHVLISASHAESRPLLIRERDFAARGRALLLENNPSLFFSGSPVAGYTPNIRSNAPLVGGVRPALRLKPQFGGALLGSSFTSVPVGYAGAASDNGAGLDANAGQYNLDLPDTFQSARRSLLNNPTLQSAAINLRRDFGARVEAFADFSWNANQGESFGGTVPSSVTLAASAQNNPFTDPILVAFPATGLSAPTHVDSENARATGGALIRLPGDWTAAVDYVWSRAQSSAVSTNPLVGDPDGTAGPGISVTTALSSGTLDVLRDLNAVPLEWAPYLLPSPNRFSSADTLFNDATLRLSGPLLTLPAGALTLSSLVEHRKEEAEDVFLEQINANAVPIVSFFPARSQTVTSYYLETRAPVFSDANALPLVKLLELQASVRRDEYETKAPDPTSAVLPSRQAPLPVLTERVNTIHATKYTLGLRYEPIKDVMLRASIGTGFLPPSIGQLVPITFNGVTSTLVDPKRGNVPTSVTYDNVRGGNPDLVPEDSESWSAGVVFAPRFLTGLRLSVDYTHINKSDEITGLAEQDILNFEDLLPGRVVRDPLEANAPPGYTGGAITTIDASSVNIANTELEAYDFQADYSLPVSKLGNLQFYVIATLQPHFERQTVPGALFLHSVGFNSGPLKWRGNAGATWNRGPWMLGWTAQYYDAYFTYSATADAAGIAAATLNQGSAKIPSQTYHDLHVRYRFNDTLQSAQLLDGVEILLGIQNVLDESPPILATSGSSGGGYSTYGDPRLRRYSITLTKSFGGR